MVNKKYYLISLFYDDGEDGWIYTKTPGGKYLIQALLISDLEHSFWNRKQLLKEHGVAIVDEEYDDSTRPDYSVLISETRAKDTIKRWQKLAKKLWLQK